MKRLLFAVLVILLIVWRSYAPSNYVGNPTFATSFVAGIKTVSGNYTVIGNDYNVRVLTLSSVNLPKCSKNSGRILLVKALNAGGCDIVPFAGDTIDGGGTRHIANLDSVTIQSNGSTTWDSQ